MEGTIFNCTLLNNNDDDDDDDDENNDDNNNNNTMKQSTISYLGVLNLQKQNISIDTIKQPRIYIGKSVTTII